MLLRYIVVLFLMCNYSMLIQVMLLCNVMLCCVMFCYVMLCYVMSCYVMVCYDMLCSTYNNYPLSLQYLYCLNLLTSKAEADLHTNINITLVLLRPTVGLKSLHYYLLNDKFIWLAIRFRAKALGTSFWFLIWSIFALGKSYLFISFSPETLPLDFWVY